MTTGHFTVYRSSAGSGKTYTLVRQYLKLALSGEQPFHSILAITFTNKAASEMKQRIINALQAFAGEEKLDDVNENLCHDLCGDLNISEAEIRQRALQLLKAILHRYSDFHVRTIDSFLHKIVRTFARDLGLNVNFQIELESDPMLAEAVDRLIHRAGNPESFTLTALLVDFVLSKTQDEKGWNTFDRDIFKVARTLMDEDSFQYFEKLRDISLDAFVTTGRDLRRLKNQADETITEWAQKACDLIAEAGLTVDHFHQKGRGIAGFFEKLSIDVSTENIQSNSYVLDAVHEDRWYSTSSKDGRGRVIDRIKPELIACYEHIKKQVPFYILVDAVLQNLYATAVLQEINDILENLKKEAATILISDFNRHISSVVRDEPTPFIYERVGEKFLHYMIDEFQDTSAMQWLNILPLVENALANGGTTLVVGDGKQAIYRWRGGDLEQFDRLPELPGSETDDRLKETESALAQHYREEPLKYNYRSLPEIVSFNNRFFEWLARYKETELKKTYHDIRQLPKNGSTGGYIHIEFLPRADETTIEDRVNEKLYETIQSLKEDGYAWNDIAILTRNNERGSAIARFLMSRNIHVISAESLLIDQSAEVRIILSVLRYLNDVSDKVNRMALMNGILTTVIGRSPTSEDRRIMADAVQERKRFLAWLKDRGIELDERRLLRQPLYEMTEDIVRSFLPTLISSPFVIYFLDAVLNYSIKYDNTLINFLKWWDIQKDKLSIVAPDETDAVRVSTVHKAKGLEFPVVIIDEASWQFKKTRDYIWTELRSKPFKTLPAVLLKSSPILEETECKKAYDEESDKNFLDQANLLYVAMTRAMERLYLFSVLTKKAVDNKITELKSVNDVVVSFLRGSMNWEDGKMIYSFGDAVAPAMRRALKHSSVSLQDFITNPRLPQLRTKRYSRFQPYEDISRREWGKLVHAALAQIRTLDDILPVLNAEENEGWLNPDQRHDLSEKLLRLFSHEMLMPYFKHGARVRTEAEVLLDSKELLRMDRVIMFENEVVVIDYKTGEEEGEEHTAQIQRYGGALEKLGYSSVKKFLVYIEDEKILPVA
ncbi:UvrD-helicase domain-containing protein [bacterium]|nr:UvrD-helicase domain-containing protein [bacterium]